MFVWEAREFAILHFSVQRPEPNKGHISLRVFDRPPECENSAPARKPTNHRPTDTKPMPFRANAILFALAGHVT